MPAGVLEAKVTLPSNFEVSDQEIFLFAPVPRVLQWDRIKLLASQY
jgi:hypothetical protein